MNAAIDPTAVPVTVFVRDGRAAMLTVSVPEGWDDVKKILNNVLTFDGKTFQFSGWNSDRNEAYFRPAASVARMGIAV